MPRGKPSSGSKQRERRAITAVACPDCGAPRGALCRRPVGDGTYQPMLQYGRPMICTGRRTAWQMIRDREIE
jgi:hypothetical protein